MTVVRQRSHADSGVKVLLATIRREAAKRRRRVLCVVLVGAAALGGLAGFGPLLRGLVMAAGRYMVITVAGFVGWALQTSDAQKRAVRDLAVWDDINAIGDLVEATRFHDRATRRAAASALKHLLPCLTESGSRLIDAHHRRLLRQMLLANRDEALSLEVIETLAKVGDTGAISTLRVIAAAPAAGRYTGLRDAAAVCLRLLEARADEERTRATLLRAAQPGTEESDRLLRARAGPAPAADGLLRSAREQSTGAG